MAFDITTARPIQAQPKKKGGFDLSTAKPVTGEFTDYQKPVDPVEAALRLGGATDADFAPVPSEPEPGAIETLKGAGEAALSVGTGATGGLLGMVKGTAEGLAKEIMSGNFGTQEAAKRIEQLALQTAQQYTYEPKTQSGQDILKAGAELAAPLAALPAFAPELQTISQASRMAAPQVKAMAQTAADKRAQRQQPRSAGAAGVPMAVVREAKARGLPVPIDLTRGELLRDEDLLTFEREVIKYQDIGLPLRERQNESMLRVLQNFDELIEETDSPAGGDVVLTGSNVIKALSKGNKEAKARTRAAYKKARESEEAQRPVDTTEPVFLDSYDGDNPIQASIWDYMNSRPSGVDSAKAMDSARAAALNLGLAVRDIDGKLIPNPAKQQITIADMEDLRREISGIAKFDDKTGIRDETIMKKLIDEHTQQVEGSLYKQARKLREQQGRKYENRAVIARLINNVKNMDDRKVPADKVFKRTILSSSPEEITFLKRVLNTTGEDGKAAWNDLQAATYRYIQENSSGGFDANDNPIFRPAALSRIIKGLDQNGRLELMLGKKNARILRDLSDVVAYIKTSPPNTLINNSGTAGMLMAALGEAGAQTVVTGRSTPIISFIRFIGDAAKSKRLKKKVKESLQGLKESERDIE